ncbi:MAG TPA: SDR family NAD(P)-dependent oxidoreductase [Steroidobacter sp.]|uniref:SDR family NAD(P)-dependent oxidoreductase n=1 Tax=Steroidobacter sp. TaxID=1978227 RepID=UPI002EDACED4
MADFTDRVAVITGAATGIGEGIARRLFAGGASIVVSGHNREGLEALLQDIDPKRQRSRAVEADVRDPEAMRAVVETAVKTFGGLHLAVNNAGITGPHDTLIEDLSLDDWRAVIDTDVTGMFLSLKAEIPAMRKSGGGAIVNLSSGNGIVGVAGIAAYTAAKHAVVGLTRSVALENADKGIRVNCIGPGYVATPRIQEMPEVVRNEWAQLHPTQRLVTREEVAELAAFLLSNRAPSCTGGFYPIDGGSTAR